MKRTITLRVDVADAAEYADAVEAIVQAHPSICASVWTSGEEIKTLLETRSGNKLFWAKGAGSKWIAENS